MPTNHVSLSLSTAQLDAAHAALDTLEQQLAALVSMSGAEHRAMFKMGERSEVFCRETLATLADNPKLVPEALGLPEALADLGALDALRPLLRRLQQLVARAESTELALGADVFSCALEGYNLLKVSGKHHGLEGKRRELSHRFDRRSRKAAPAAADAPVP